MKKQIIFSLVSLTTLTTVQIFSYQLTSPILKAADGAGIFDKPIVDILRVRESVKKLASGKYLWQGAQISLNIVDQHKKNTGMKISVLLRRVETLFGATFVIMSPDHKDLLNVTSNNNVETVQTIISQTHHKSLYHRQENANFSGIPTGYFAQHPITQELMPLYVSDYALEYFDTRLTKAHFGVPAHHAKDFIFAQQNQLPIKLVVSAPEALMNAGKIIGPLMSKDNKTLLEAYTGEYEDCIIVNSDFLNGSIKNASSKIIAYLEDHKLGIGHQEPILYSFNNEQYSMQDLQTVEMTLIQEKKELSADQKESLKLLLHYAQSDFLDIVEQFLVNAKENKELMLELIEESCKLRKNNDCYLLKWSHLDSSISERIIFKRDIITFNGLTKFCTDLVNFLTDFASSCPHALENLKRLKDK